MCARSERRREAAYGVRHVLSIAGGGDSCPLESRALSALPRVSPETREEIVAQIDRVGGEEFSRMAIRNLETANPELLQMAHAFASQRADYARTMQGFGLLHEALLCQSQKDRLRPH